MYGFAIWDSRRQRLLLGRDRLGIKPLYYWEHGGGLSFGSELRSFLVDPAFKPQLSEEAIALYLSFGYVPDPHCIFRGVRKLPPGHVLTWSRDERRLGASLLVAAPRRGEHGGTGGQRRSCAGCSRTRSGVISSRKSR